MNEMIKPGEVFKLAELLPYSEVRSSIWILYIMRR